jgi:hypothetical protein
MTDPTTLLPRMPPGSTLHLHAVPVDDGHVDYPAEVAVFRVPGTPGGCMVWALYAGAWQPNRGERYALRLLMDAARPADPTTPVRIPAPMIAAAREATGLPNGEAVREVLGRALTLDSRVDALEARLAALEGDR